MDTIQSILNAMMREALSPQTAAVAIAVIGLNIHFGFTGLLNMGQSGFMLLGAYGFGDLDLARPAVRRSASCWVSAPRWSSRWCSAYRP